MEVTPEKIQLYDFQRDEGIQNTNIDKTAIADTAPAEREEWGKGIEFILSLLGYAVGLGNLWRFPYLCVRNGGGAFLIPFLFVLVTCGLPIFFLEVSLGQFRGKGILHVWEICPLFKGIGIGMVITLSVTSIYYNTIIAWTLYYMGSSLQSEVPWSRCDEWWTTDSCFKQGVAYQSDANDTVLLHLNDTQASFANTTTNRSVSTLNNGNISGKATLSPMSSTEQFWLHNVLQISSGLDEVGYPSWYMAVSMISAWVLVFLCIFKGVKSIGKVVYVTALLPYVLLVVILIRGVTLPGAVDGIIQFIKPDLQRMMTLQVWVEAALQVFYSLGPGWGPLIVMSSFCKFNENTLRTSVFITFLGEGTSIVSGFVVFTILGFMAHDLGVPVQEVVKSGPGLGFVAYPQALARLPLPQLWSFIFFFMLTTVGLDSQFATVEATITAITDSFPQLQRRRTLVTATVCAVMCALGLPFICQGGIYSFQIIDWYVAAFGVPLFCLLECLMIGWVYGAERFSHDISLMIGRGVPVFIRFCWCIISPLILLLCLVVTITTYKPPTYGGYEYPTHGYVIGWIISLIPVVPVLVVPLYLLYVSPGRTLKRKLSLCAEPSPEWGPHPGECNVCYDDVKFSYHGYSVLQRIRLNLTGKG